MCPDQELISLYYDGELPSPWKEKVKKHLSECPDCTARLKSYQSLSDALVVPLALNAVRERVWENIAPFHAAPRRERFWRRHVSLPLPAAAAAALVFLAALGVVVRLLVVSGSQSPSNHPTNNGLALEAGALTPVSDLNGVLRYLGDTENGDIIVIRLPDGAHFTNSGEPSLVRAADYTRLRPPPPAPPTPNEADVIEPAPNEAPDFSPPPAEGDAL